MHMLSLKTAKVWSPLFCTLALAIGCVADDGADDVADDTSGEEPEWAQVSSELPRDTNPTISDADKQALGDDQAALALDIYHALRQGDFEGKSFSVSPVSIQAAFGMLYGGTTGQARTELEATLHFSIGDEAQHAALDWQDLELAQRNMEGDADPEYPLDPVVVKMANGVWVRNDMAEVVKPDFLDILATYYGSGLYLADFAAEPERERLDINLWVANRTNQLIPELFKKGMIVETTTAVLVNALYLKAPWATPFEEHATSPAPFTLLDGSSKDVQMMHNYAVDGSYLAGEGFAAFGMPLRGNKLEMVFIVPDAFGDFEPTLDGPTLTGILDNMEFTMATVSVPRFELEADIVLSGVLRDELGMPTPFTDSTSFLDIGDGFGVITEVVHNTVIKVDEKGTEAAAATGIVLGEDGGPEPQFEFKADKPFVVLIYDRPTRSPLFVGRVLDPG